MFQQFVVKRLISLVALLLLGSSSLAFSQVAPAAVSGSGLNVFASFGGLKTHVISYTYNALGVEAGLFIQRSPLFGVEVRGSTYPMFARYSQSPITAGYRMEVNHPRFRDLRLSGYFGGGMSKAQDAGPHYVATPAEWAPCWQVSQGMTINMGHWKWRPYDATLTETYTSRRTLRGFSMTTGLVYTFSRIGRQP